MKSGESEFEYSFFAETKIAHVESGRESSLQVRIVNDCMFGI